MATKLKNFSRAWYIKAIAYLLVAATAAGVLLYVGNRGGYQCLDNLGPVSYEEAYDVRSYFIQYGEAAAFVANVNPDELDINNKKYWNFDETENASVSADGDTYSEEAGDDTDDITETELTTETAEVTVEDTNVYLTIPIANAGIAEDVRTQMRNFYNVWWNEDGHVHLTVSYDSYGNLHYQSNYDVSYDKEINLSYSNFLKEHPDMERKVLAGVLKRWSYNYQIAEKTLEDAVENVGLIYDIAKEDSDKLIEKYSALPIYVRIENGSVTESSEPNLEGMTVGGRYYNLEYSFYDEYAEQGKICYMAMSREYYEAQKAEWIQNAELGNKLMAAMVMGLAVIAVCFLYLALVTGRGPEEEEVHLYRIDSVWSEVQWTAGCYLVAGLIGILAEVVFSSYIIADLYYNVAVALMVIMGMALMSLLLSQIRLLKAHKWLDSLICVRLLKKCFGLIKKAWTVVCYTWKRGTLSMRAMIMAIALPILCGSWIGIPFVIAFLIYMIYRHMDDFLAICEGAEKIRNGQLNYQIAIKNKGGELEKLANDINEISQGLENAVSSELRSEHLKAELISNVSHDLKTPLTSIVTYVDLLKQEEIENETARDYIEVIDRKAKRLTVLTNDLFEAAKASSGDMPVNIETVDLNALVRQALGEFDEKLEKAELNIRLTLPEAPAYVKADGRLTWRVIDNLLGNVVKYGQMGSRVYIEVKDMGNTIGFTIKNISACELNIPADELMERFKRGDESRNSEGSGLGLSIANSLIDLQHGSFKISIDGDLFKAEFELPKSV